jgi:hypothetical protein
MTRRESGDLTNRYGSMLSRPSLTVMTKLSARPPSGDIESLNGSKRENRATVIIKSSGGN